MKNNNIIITPSFPLGTLDLDLTAMPEPVQDAGDCDLHQLPPEDVPDEGGEAAPVKPKKPPPGVTLIDIFHKKRIKGWWPVFSSEEGERELMVGKPASHQCKIAPNPFSIMAWFAPLYRVNWS